MLTVACLYGKTNGKARFAQRERHCARDKVNHERGRRLMQTDLDTTACAVISFPDSLCGDSPETGPARFTPPVPVACPLADFARRVRACDTSRRLDMLHTLMLRSVPVGQRAGYIALLNQRDEELSFQDPGHMWQA
ncbi:TPA: hypothetical protein ACNV1G_004816 [Citrobacter amalonaticus]